MKIKKGDQILIISGKDKGKTGKVLRVSNKDKKIIAENINIKKRHVKPRKSGEKGQIISVPAFFDVSNVKIICSKCKKAVRIGYKKNTENQKSKIRICKKCGEVI